MKEIARIVTLSNLLAVALGSLLTFLMYNYLYYSAIPKLVGVIGKEIILRHRIATFNNIQLLLLGIFFTITVFIAPIILLVKKNTVNLARLYLLLEIIFLVLLVSLMQSIIEGKVNMMSVVSLFIISTIIVKFLIIILNYSVAIIKRAFIEQRDIAVTIAISILTSVITGLTVLITFRR